MDTGKSANWIETPADNVGDVIVAAVAAGGIDHLFFTSGSEIGFFQEATAKARALGHNKPVRLVTVPHEHASLNAALGFAAVSGRPAITAAHVDCGTQHYGGAVHTAMRSNLPVVITAYADKSFTFIIKTPPTTVLIKKAAGIESGSAKPHTDKGGKITRKQAEEIARQKMPDLTAAELEAAVRTVAGSARSMGIVVEDV